MHLRLGLELTVFQLRSHTWFQHSVKLRFLMTHYRKNSARDKVIGKKWIYLQRNTLRRQRGPSQNVSCCSVTRLCSALCCPMDCSTPVFPLLHVSWSLLKLLSFESVLLSNDLILCRLLLLLPSIFPSIRVFSNESSLHIRWPKYWSFSISPSNEYSGLISFRMDWLDLLAVQGTLQESSPIPQFKSINSSVLSFLYNPTLTSINDYWKNHSLD